MAGKVLVVEDEEAIRRLLIDCLQDAALEVDAARDGVDALHHVSGRTYDVVILDLMMPYMTGVDFLDSLRVMISDPSVPSLTAPPAILVVTGMTAEQIPSASIEQRFPDLVRGVLRKPLQVDELARRVEELLVAQRKE